jgi:hypothetical protein
MVNLLTVDAATANVTNTTFAHKLGLTDGPFGLQEVESVLSFPARNGRSWTVSIQTSDVATVIFTILVLTFALDHYLFRSRYLVHIGGARRDKDQAAALDEKASLHEKKALNVECGQKCSDDEDSKLEPKSEHESDSPASTTRSRWVHRAVFTLLILFLALLVGGKNEKEIASKTNKETLESSSTEAEAEGEVDKSPPTSRWGKFVQHPWSQGIVKSAIFLLVLLAMLLVLKYYLLFWPCLLTVFIMLQCAVYEYLNHGATVPWQSIALKSTLHLAIWTIIGVTLLLKPNRLQGVLWKCFKWTHAVNWWLFWGILESYCLGAFVARRIGFHYTGITMQVILLIMRPSLVAYLYSGIVCDVVVAVRLCKYFWNNDITKL